MEHYPTELSQPHINLQAVQKFSLEKLEQEDYYPDLVVHLEETFPFREAGLLDKMIEYLLKEGHDSVIAACQETGWMWRETPDGGFQRLVSGDVPREYKEKSLIGLHGLGCITYPEFFRNGQMLGGKIGLYEVGHPLAGFELRDEFSYDLATKFLDKI